MLTQDKMQQLVAELTTPYKLGRPVLEPTGRDGDFDKLMVDSPTVFRHDGRWHMMYIGFEGRGYRTGLAVSDDLLHWERLGIILDWGKTGEYDGYGSAGGSILREQDMQKPPIPLLYDGKYWLSFNAYDQPGYEAGYGSLGMAFSHDVKCWVKLPENPILSPKSGAGEWEKGTLYKSCIVAAPEAFYLFYNAKDKQDWPWIEETGFATSKDLVHWNRFPKNPVLHVTPGAWDSRFASDPYVVRYRGVWVMFYYGFDGQHAQDGIAFSSDLIQWQKWPEPILRVGKPGSIDGQHAHKPCVIWKDEVLYHFYCAVRDYDQYRCISVATSQPLR